MLKTIEELERENEGLRRAIDRSLIYDSLTNLYTKSAFYDFVRDSLVKNEPTNLDIVCVDIEHFKLVNDLHGNEFGDDLLRYIGSSLEKAFSSPQSAVGRFSADIFMLCTPRMDVADLKKTILLIFQQCPLSLKIFPVIGIYHVGDRGIPLELMCDRAMMASRTVKGNYFERVAEYNAEMRDALVEERMLVEGIVGALAKGEIVLYVQPKCNMRTGKIIGGEALVRWQHPQRGLVFPGEFIPSLERNGLIRSLDLYVWEQTLVWIRKMIDCGLKPLPVSVNVSRSDIYSLDVGAVLSDLTERYDIDPSLLEIEITESAYSEHPEQVIQALEDLADRGFSVLMDDFGSGYSSLNMLKDINVAVLKIDMKFLDKSDQKSKDILESVVHMSKWLDMPVIAEGVENKDQVQFLLDIGCVYAQGFFYYHPMPIERFMDLIELGEEIEYEPEGEWLKAESRSILDFKDLLHEDSMSTRMLSNILGAIALYSYCDGDLRIVRGNAAYFDLTGLLDTVLEEGEERSALEEVLEEDQVKLIEAIESVQSTHDDAGIEVVVRCWNNHAIQWVQMRLFYLYTQKNVATIYTSLFDVTDRMEAAEKLRMSEDRFRIAMETKNDVIFELDIKKRIVRNSQSTQEAFGFGPEDMVAPEEFISMGTICEESVDTFNEVYEAIYRGYDRASASIKVRKASGVKSWCRITITAIKDANDHPVKAVGLVEDITYEKERELQLGRQTIEKLSEENQRILISLISEVAPYCVIGRYFELGSPLFFANEEIVAFLGYETYADFAETTRLTTRSIIDPEDVALFEVYWLNLSIGDEYDVCYNMIKKDGTMVLVEEKGRVIEAEDGRRASIGLCIDRSKNSSFSSRLKK